MKSCFAKRFHVTECLDIRAGRTLATQFNIPPGPLVVICCHLSNQRQEACCDIILIVKHLRGVSPYCAYICGDMNFGFSLGDKICYDGVASVMIPHWRALGCCAFQPHIEAYQPDFTYRAFARVARGPRHSRFDRIQISTDCAAMSAFTVQTWLVGDRIGGRIPFDHVSVCASISLSRSQPALLPFLLGPANSFRTPKWSRKCVLADADFASGPSWLSTSQSRITHTMSPFGLPPNGTCRTNMASIICAFR